MSDQFPQEGAEGAQTLASAVMVDGRKFNCVIYQLLLSLRRRCMGPAAHHSRSPPRDHVKVKGKSKNGIWKCGETCDYS